MKKPILPILTAIAALMPLAFAPLRAQDDSKPKEEKKEAAQEEKDKPQKEESKPEKDEKKPEKDEKKPEEDAEPEGNTEEEDKEAEKAELATVKKMLSVFQPLEGEWVGSEKVTYNENLKRKPKTWKDEWKGFFTQNGRYFEMTGKSDGDLSSTYHWYVTYDTSEEEFRAWNFGSTGFTEYNGELSKDRKAVVWKKTSEGEEQDVEDTFELRADGNRCTAKGDTRILSKDGRQSVTYAEQTSSYTRKKIEI